MAGMFVNLRKKAGLVTVGYIIDLKWLPQTNCIDGKNVCSIFMGSIASVHGVRLRNE